MDFITAQNRAKELTKQLEYHNNLYYNQDEPEISDYSTFTKLPVALSTGIME